ncbi:hypothetical protein EVAR_52618_1 [Eumeta japonica]|uniref:Uncharacterized protein n=1 Tax=Eumeta variegata TaxID=151549 RepID=A0A4C1YQN2_EUMVA|nr:hypothetical protein EVAR_52618_1 [Eumeta japonica]
MYFFGIFRIISDERPIAVILLKYSLCARSVHAGRRTDGSESISRPVIRDIRPPLSVALGARAGPRRGRGARCRLGSTADGHRRPGAAAETVGWRCPITEIISRKKLAT